MCSYHRVKFSVAQLLLGRGALLFRGRAGYQSDLYPRLTEQRLKLAVVLLSEYLGRRHHRTLYAGLRSCEYCGGSHNGLSAADISGQYSAHRRSGRIGAHIASDIGYRPSLCSGRLERQQRVERFEVCLSYLKMPAAVKRLL